MPELPVPPLRTVACSEPLWLDGAIYVALEALDRSEIRVWRAPGGRMLDASIVTTLPGAPTQDASEGPRAMWPRMAEFAPGWQVAYQRGTRLAWVDSSNLSPVAINLSSHGIWPVAVRQDTWLGSQTRQATPVDGSQGIFGYLDGQWWSFDRIRQSAYATPYPAGVLFHGWRDRGVLHLLFTEGSATIPDRVVLCTDEDGQWNRYVVFEGRAEYPRGCSTPEGVYIHAVGEGGQYRAAIGPFPKLESPSMPTPTIAVLGYARSGITPATFGFAFSCANAVTIRKLVTAPDGRVDTEDMPAPASGSGYGEVTRTEVGTHRLTLEAISADGQRAATGAVRTLEVLPVPETPRPEPQVITEAELDVMTEDLAYVREQATAIGERAYYNARCAGKDQGEALATMRQAIADAVLSQEDES